MLKLDLRQDILGCVGDTPMLPLRRIVPAGGARILVKLEAQNPTGSMKDRMALAMIDAAEADGRLRPGGAVVEYTGGSTGVSLALVCAVKGHPLHIVTSDAFAKEKLDHMRLLGAQLQIVPSDGGRMTAKLTRDMVEAARVDRRGVGRLLDRPAEESRSGHRLPPDGGGDLAAGRRAGRRFVQSVGTAGSLRGTAERLRARRPARPRSSPSSRASRPVLSGRPSGAHRIDGVGAGFVVPLWQEGLADRIELVSTEEAMAMAFRLAREEGVFAGTSTGANVLAALRVAGESRP